MERSPNLVKSPGIVITLFDFEERKRKLSSVMRFVVLLALIGLAEAFTTTSTLPYLRRSVARSTCASGGLSMMGGDTPEKAALVTGKTWGARTFVREHVTLASQLPAYLAAYVGPKAALEPKLTEAIM